MKYLIGRVLEGESKFGQNVELNEAEGVRKIFEGLYKSDAECEAHGLYF